MLIPPRYNLNHQLTLLLQKIEAAKEIIATIPLPSPIEQNIRRQSTLKSSLYSARIEGNELLLEDVLTPSSQTQQKIEVFNTLKALNWIHRRARKDLTLPEICSLHQTVLQGLSTDAGKFRTQMNAIFNTAGIAIYMPPHHKKLPSLLGKLITYANSDKEKLIPIKACITHYVFEKIHPFIDGNGRVGRLVLQKVLHHGGYGMKGLLAIEEYLDQHRAAYYRALEEPEKDITDYLEFMLTALAESAEISKQLVVAKQQADTSDYLLPRRAEMLHIIQDHQLVNFDMLKRRFPKVNDRTLRYDLKKLQDDGLIIKLGATNGAYYKPLTNK